MSLHSDKTVAVIDPIWVGHHPMYVAQFAASFLRHGARVIIACPDPDDAKREMVALVGEDVVRERIIFRNLGTAQRSLFNGRFEGDPLRTATRWKQAADVIASAENEIGRAVDLVYFPYLDTYLRFFPIPIAPEIILGRAWSGLYLRNHHYHQAAGWKRGLMMLGKGDAILRSESCLGIGVLDERFIPQMERHSGKTVSPFPDFTNTKLPASPTEQADAIVRQAAGRKIIGIIGLERRKGLLTLLKAARLAHERDLPFFFVCAGRIFEAEYSTDEWESICQAADGGLSNLHLDPDAGRIPSEEDFNSLFSVFDIAWAAYENFHGSSNTLGKAAAFGIPCLASEGECIGGRVKAYGTGLTIPEGDAELALAAISRMAENPPAGRYAEFCEQHSIRRLDELLGELLGKV